jgi:hypothetical protein
MLPAGSEVYSVASVIWVGLLWVAPVRAIVPPPLKAGNERLEYVDAGSNAAGAPSWIAGASVPVRLVQSQSSVVEPVRIGAVEGRILSTPVPVTPFAARVPTRMK